MIKTTILAVTILFSITMMMQEVYAPEEPEKLTLGGTGASGPVPMPYPVTTTKAIPSWVNGVMGFYLDGDISEREMLDAFDYLFKNNIMHVSQEAAQEVADLRAQVAEQQATIGALKTLGSAQTLATTPTVDDITAEGDSEAGGASMTDEFGRIKVQFPWGSSQADIDQFIDEMKKSIDSLPTEQQASAISSLRTLVSSQAMHTSGDGGSVNIQAGDASTTGDDGSFTFAVDVDTTLFASEIVDDIMTKGGTTSAWEDGIAAFSDMGYKYVPPYTTSESSLYAENRLDGEMVAMAMNTVIEKESQIIDAELKMIEEWLEIIEEKQETTGGATGTNYGVAGTATGGTTDYNQSDLDFITRKLAHIDQQINSLDTGIKVLEEHLQSTGDDGQMMQMQLQDAMNKQQQAMQTLSAIMKAQHDTLKAIISNMRG